MDCRELPSQVMRITKGNLVFAVRRARFSMTQIMVEINKDADASSLLTRILSSGWIPNLKFLKRIVIAIVGFTVLLLGVVMIILPGPAFIIIPLGLAILATEFVWAERLLTKAKAYFEKQRKRVADKMRGKK